MSKPRHNLDFDTHSAMVSLPRALMLLSPDDIKILKDGLQRLQENMIAGLIRTPVWADAELHRAFPNIHLRFRYDLNIWQCWVIEKWCSEIFDSWVIVHKYFEDGVAPQDLNYSAVAKLIQILHEGDTSRFSSIEEFKAHRQAVADANKKRHDAEVEEGILERVDGLSTKSLNTMVDALIAVQTGDVIHAHGADEKFLEESYKNTQQAAQHPENPAVCLNPGQNPRIRKD